MIIRNFLFHRVSTEKDPMWPPMQPGLFERIIRQLVKDFTVVPLEHYLKEPRSFPAQKKIATILFDDGYKDNIEYAAPILKKFNCPASFYIVTDCIDRNIPTWTYILDNLLLQTRRAQVELPFEFVPVKFKSVPLKSGDNTHPLVKELKPWMKKISNKQRVDILETLLKQCSDVPAPENKMMNWDDIRQIKAEGFMIGSHSHTHPCLSTLPDEKEIKDELRESGKRMQTETGDFPETISYPMNNYDERVIRIAKETGYSFGLAVGEKFYDTRSDNMYSIPRSELHEEPWWKIKMRVNGMYSRIKSVWR